MHFRQIISKINPAGFDFKNLLTTCLKNTLGPVTPRRRRYPVIAAADGGVSKVASETVLKIGEVNKAR
jgi:hypothetical protein